MFGLVQYPGLFITNSLIEVRDVCVRHLAGTIFVCEWNNDLILPKLSEQGKPKHLADLYDFDFISSSDVVDAMFVRAIDSQKIPVFRCCALLG